MQPMDNHTYFTQQIRPCGSFKVEGLVEFRVTAEG